MCCLGATTAPGAVAIAIIAFLAPSSPFSHLPLTFGFAFRSIQFPIYTLTACLTSRRRCELQLVPEWLLDCDHRLAPATCSQRLHRSRYSI